VFETVDEDARPFASGLPSGDGSGSGSGGGGGGGGSGGSRAALDAQIRALEAVIDELRRKKAA
jgi:hypothetical protein